MAQIFMRQQTESHHVEIRFLFTKYYRVRCLPPGSIDDQIFRPFSLSERTINHTLWRPSSPNARASTEDARLVCQFDGPTHFAEA